MITEKKKYQFRKRRLRWCSKKKHSAYWCLMFLFWLSSYTLHYTTIIFYWKTKIFLLENNYDGYGYTRTSNQNSYQFVIFQYLNFNRFQASSTYMLYWRIWKKCWKVYFWWLLMIINQIQLTAASKKKKKKTRKLATILASHKFNDYHHQNIHTHTYIQDRSIQSTCLLNKYFFLRLFYSVYVWYEYKDV